MSFSHLQPQASTFTIAIPYNSVLDPHRRIIRDLYRIAAELKLVIELPAYEIKLPHVPREEAEKFLSKAAAIRNSGVKQECASFLSKLNLGEIQYIDKVSIRGEDFGAPLASEEEQKVTIFIAYGKVETLWKDSVDLIKGIANLKELAHQLGYEAEQEFPLTGEREMIIGRGSLAITLERQAAKIFLQEALFLKPTLITSDDLGKLSTVKAGQELKIEIPRPVVSAVTEVKIAAKPLAVAAHRVASAPPAAAGAGVGSLSGGPAPAQKHVPYKERMLTFRTKFLSQRPSSGGVGDSAAANPSASAARGFVEVLPPSEPPIPGPRTALGLLKTLNKKVHPVDASAALMPAPAPAAPLVAEPFNAPALGAGGTRLG